MRQARSRGDSPAVEYGRDTGRFGRRDDETGRLGRPRRERKAAGRRQRNIVSLKNNEIGRARLERFFRCPERIERFRHHDEGK